MDVKVRDNACSDVLKEFHVWERRGGRVVDVQYVHNDFDLESKCVRNDQVTQNMEEMTSVSYTVSTLIRNMYICKNMQYMYIPVKTNDPSLLTGTEHYLQLGTHKKALEAHVRTSAANT